MAAIRYPSVYRDIQSSNGIAKLKKMPQESQKINPLTDNFKFGQTSTSAYDVEEFFHYHLKPILWLLRVLGAFPVIFDPSGLPKFKLLSPVTAYSICFYLSLNFITWVLICDYYTDMQSFGGDLSDSIYSVLFISFFAFNVWVPLTAWVDVSSTCQYVSNWAQFQVRFGAVTKNRIQLNLRKFALLAFFPILGSSLFTFLVAKTSPHAISWKLPGPIIASMYFASMAVLKVLMFVALLKAGAALGNSFKRDLFMKPTSPNVVEDYRLLWLRWSRLVSQEECMFGTMYAFTLIKMLFVVVITLYSCLMNIKTGQVDWHRQTNTLFPCIYGVGTLFFMCRNAQRLSDLGREFQNNLETISPSTVSSYVWIEVKSFLDTIKMNPPVVTAIGFTNVNKPLFIALMSSMVTYMIVLLQFDKGDTNSQRYSSDPTEEIPTSIAPTFS